MLGLLTIAEMLILSVFINWLSQQETILLNESEQVAEIQLDLIKITVANGVLRFILDVLIDLSYQFKWPNTIARQIWCDLLHQIANCHAPCYQKLYKEKRKVLENDTRVLSSQLVVILVELRRVGSGLLSLVVACCVLNISRWVIMITTVVIGMIFTIMKRYGQKIAKKSTELQKTENENFPILQDRIERLCDDIRVHQQDNGVKALEQLQTKLDSVKESKHLLYEKRNISIDILGSMLVIVILGSFWAFEDGKSSDAQLSFYPLSSAVQIVYSLIYTWSSISRSMIELDESTQKVEEVLRIVKENPPCPRVKFPEGVYNRLTFELCNFRLDIPEANYSLVQKGGVVIDGLVGLFADNGSGKSVFISALSGRLDPKYIDKNSIVIVHAYNGSNKVWSQQLQGTEIPGTLAHEIFVQSNESVKLTVKEKPVGCLITDCHDPECAGHEWNTDARVQHYFDDIFTGDQRMHDFQVMVSKNTKLSDGQTSKVGFAQVLHKIFTTKPSIAVTDEPDKGLDHKARKKLGNWLSRMTSFNSNANYIVVVHDEELQKLFPKRITICDGVIKMENPSFDNSVIRRSRAGPKGGTSALPDRSSESSFTFFYW